MFPPFETGVMACRCVVKLEICLLVFGCFIQIVLSEENYKLFCVMVPVCGSAWREVLPSSSCVFGSWEVVISARF